MAIEALELSELRSFRHNGELPEGTNIEEKLQNAMVDMGYNGTLEYWQGDAEVGTTKGYDRGYFVNKIKAAGQILQGERDDVDQQDIDDTLAFAEEIFDIYEGKRAPARESGSFAFTAATRLQRTKPGEFQPVDYRRETIGCFPMFKYLDGSSAQRVMVGMPPFLLDYYGHDHKGGGGMMVFSPLFLDLIPDAGEDLMKAITWAQNIAKETAWLAKERADIKLLSLAALLPKHTEYGKWFDYPGIDTTTGHGGTTWLIGEMVKRVINKGRINPKLANKIGVLGAGGIGKASADFILGENPDAIVGINDYNKETQRKVAQELAARYGENRVIEMPDAEAVLRFGGVTVSAITRPIDLIKDTNLKPGDLAGRAYVDDSQPAAIAAEQVEALGGLHSGVIAQDNTDWGAVKMNRFNYGGLGPKEDSQAYGCCVEGAALHYGGGIEHRITEPVDGDMVRRVGEYCTALGFTAARLQTLRNGEAVWV